MTISRTTRIILEPWQLRKVHNGADRVVPRLVSVLKSEDFAVEVQSKHDAVADFGGYTIYDAAPSSLENSVTFWRAYHPSFFRIEKNTEMFWWDVMNNRFDPTEQNPRDSVGFFKAWQERLFGEAPHRVEQDGSILIPLQAHLLRKRRFQLCSPVNMIKQTAKRFPDRQILLTVHPRVNHSVEELAALLKIQSEYANVHLSERSSFDVLRTCDFVVTQNSSVGFFANFFCKPVVMFAPIDFYHIALNVKRLTAERAFDLVETHRPDYAGFVRWFWQEQSVNLRMGNAENRIRLKLRQNGWPI
jgi:hypothetical protein